MPLRKKAYEGRSVVGESVGIWIFGVIFLHGAGRSLCRWGPGDSLWNLSEAERGRRAVAGRFRFDTG